MDIGNTWTANNGNTKIKKVEKTAIQLARMGTAYVIGSAEHKAIVAGVVGEPETAGASTAVIAGGVAVDVVSAYAIEAVQNRAYKKFNIK